MTKDEENRLFINLLARSMAEFPLWAQKRRAKKGEDRADGHCDQCADKDGKI